MFFASVKQGLIKEIERGLKIEFIDNAKEILSIVPKMVTSTTATINTLMRFEIEGIFSLIKNEATKNAIKVRILVDIGK
jgi:hypothetical protein